MPKHRLFHGTRVGTDEITLEKFLVTGALSSCTDKEKVRGQDGGFFVSFEPGWANLFGSHSEQRGGRGMVVVLETDFSDVQNWDVDHEMSIGCSIQLLGKLKHLLPEVHIKEEVPFFTTGNKVTDIKIQASDDDYIAVYNEIGPDGSVRKGEQKIPIPKNMWGTADSQLEAFWLSQVQQCLRKEYPKEYNHALQDILGLMSGTGRGCMKYVGATPHKVAKIYLRPAVESFGDFPTNEELASWRNSGASENFFRHWEVVYDAAAFAGHSFKKTLRPAMPNA